MIQIRFNAFETNSSSTHCLVLSTSNSNKKFKDRYEEFLKSKLALYPFGYTPTYFTILDDPLDKIRYLYSVYCQSYDNEEYYEDTCNNKLFSMLRKNFPNIEFLASEKNTYSFDDCEYLTSDDEINCILESDDIFLNFIFNGIIIFCDRDSEEDSDKIDSYKYNDVNCIFIKVSG